jgi:pilus assembly protein TadC
MDESYERAKRRVEQLKGFYIHLTVYIVINVFLFVVNFLTNPGYWWFLFVTFFWGIGLVAHGLSIFTRRGMFSKEWEDRKIREYMEKEEKE